MLEKIAGFTKSFIYSVNFYLSKLNGDISALKYLLDLPEDERDDEDREY
ncbi:MAG: hypothetical protein AABW83_01330 [Nanoarchaeota archaeon]